MLWVEKWPQQFIYTLCDILAGAMAWSFYLPWSKYTQYFYKRYFFALKTNFKSWLWFEIFICLKKCLITSEQKSTRV